MDIRKNIIIQIENGKFDDITQQTQSIEYDKINEIYKIWLDNNKYKEYFSKFIKIEENGVIKDISGLIVLYYDNVILNIREVIVFNKYIRIIFNNNNTQIYSKNNIDYKIKSNHPLIKYLEKISKAIHHDPKIPRIEIENINIRSNSILDAILKDDYSIVEKNGDLSKQQTLIYPFGCNQAQKQAIANANDTRFTIIQGPPGTGKTQTILNIITNELVQNKKIAIVSGNNEAINNINMKLQKYKIDFLTAFLGNNDNKNKFFQEQDDKNQKYDDYSINFTNKICLESLFELENNINLYHSYKITISKLDQSISELDLEHFHFSKEHKIEDCKIFNKKIHDSKSVLKIIADLEYDFNKNMLLKRLKYLFKYKITNIKKIDEKKTLLFDYLKIQYYKYKRNEFEDDKKEYIEKISKQSLNDLEQKYFEMSRQYLEEFIYEKVINNKTLKWDSKSYKNDYLNFLNRYPIIYSTTHSLNACSGNNLYDILIIDEASQVDLITALSSFNCAKKVVLVGDLMQLPHVVTKKVKEKSLEIFSQYDLPKYYEYATNSILKSMCDKFYTSNQNPNIVQPILLNEHYRCDPFIIGFCNKRFYNNRLIINTQRNEDIPIEIIQHEHANLNNYSNSKQVEIIKKIISTKCKTDIGIISPFRDQITLLEKNIDTACVVNTIHKFQGKENENIILSTVVNKITIFDDPENIDFLNNPNLLNVAISRAKNKLFVVACKEILKQSGTIINDLYRYVQYNSGESAIVNSNVYSVFDILFDEYAKCLKEFKYHLVQVSNYDSENAIATIIDDICKSCEYSAWDYKHNYPLSFIVNTQFFKDDNDKKFVLNKNTHCDFVIFDTIDKKILLTIEVDGKQHNLEPQKSRDKIKDRLLCENGIKNIRISTTDTYNKQQIRDKICSIIKVN